MLLLRSLILTLFVGFSAQASSNSLEQNVFDLSVGVKTLLLRYYHLQADEGNQQLLNELNRYLLVVGEQQQNVSNELRNLKLNNDSNPQQSVDSHWQKFRSLMQQNIHEIEVNDFPELQVVAMMRDASSAMISELEKIGDELRQNGEFSVSAIEDWTRSQKRLLLGITERYLERAASSMGAPLSNGQDINQLCQEFSAGLNSLNSADLNASALASLQRIRSQWLFIEKSATNVEAKLVPFLVMRYTSTMVDQLSRIAAS
ncbi:MULTISPECIES: hypothetical protein [Oceanospirillaceae]|jgi:hypothetical protein|uniref:hypothetical protein n=1 Tax=Oceanospirillaceae TaxID=135620 RepID=UPI00118EFCE4|nr:MULTISPECIES: hypothetical protein [Thalassolituus]MCB2385356.1 hypothetical protein [Thalassolituus alkanivorans]MCB2422245.1 hypothetical protein [Thalassolituus alkanivorans]TVV45687.1 hypothetical protein FOT50_02290 [Thalassolituus sp. C2-1]